MKIVWVTSATTSLRLQVEVRYCLELSLFERVVNDWKSNSDFISGCEPRNIYNVYNQVAFGGEWGGKCASKAHSVSVCVCIDMLQKRGK